MKIFTGKVISKKMDKTATVLVERVVIHPLYKKRFKRTKKYHVHDEIGTEVGQTVKFVACKPISKLKKWKIVTGKEKKTAPVKVETKSQESDKKPAKPAKAKK